MHKPIFRLPDTTRAPFVDMHNPAAGSIAATDIPTTPCDHPGDSANSASPSWLSELSMLLWQYADLGITPDVGLMSLDELHGVYRFLSRLQRATGGKT